ncbi:MAG TPA: hypothetical protein VFJ70_02590 [Burkholderiales bacterium]|nr:hypothetical protein [Burkholderiales bacterium]
METREAKAIAILDAFADSTGLVSAAPPRRYLWTDAFAVYTWLGLYLSRGEARFLDLATRLIAQVHAVLGAHNVDAAHPTARGLRIGKRLPERSPSEPYDPQLEWDRDGQYYHYLTRWMHALERAGRIAHDERYRAWATELAAAAHQHFVRPGGIYWKMSVDLSRPLVATQGMHDPLDGLVVMATLGLASEARELARLCAGREWATNDPLGAGGLLLDTLGLAKLVAEGRGDLQPLFARAIEDCAASLAAVAQDGFVGLRAARRLAFRELGLALGLHAVAPLGECADVALLERHVPLAAALEEFWLQPANQAGPTWTAHADINAVTLAAALAPRGSLL